MIKLTAKKSGNPIYINESYIVFLEKDERQEDGAIIGTLTGSIEVEESQKEVIDRLNWWTTKAMELFSDERK